MLGIAGAILTEAGLSFLGFGVPPPAPTWGNILDDAISASAMDNGRYLWVIVPGFCIVFIVLGFTFIGHALDEIFNPKLRKR